MLKTIASIMTTTLATAASAAPSIPSAVAFLGSGHTSYRVYFRKEALNLPGPPEILKCQEGMSKDDSTDQPTPFSNIAHTPVSFVASDFKIQADIATKLRKDGNTADYELRAYYMPVNSNVGSTLVNLRVDNESADLKTMLTADGWVVGRQLKWA